MDNSLNSDSELTAGQLNGLAKTAFSSRPNRCQCFDVSSEESIASLLDSQSDLVSDTTSCESFNVVPFRKSRKSIPHSFNVSSDESLYDESEQTITYSEPQGLFAKKNKSLMDLFNVSFNETNAQESTLGNSSDVNDSEVSDKTNPFKKKNDSLTQLRLSVMEESRLQETFENNNQTASNMEIHDSIDLSASGVKSNSLREKESESEIQITLDSPKEVSTLKKSKVNNKKSVCLDENLEVKYKPPKLLKPASFVSKQLYGFIRKKLEPKYGIDAVIESENIVSLICDTVKKVTRRKNYQKGLIKTLKKEMAEAGLIETTMDFYEFVIKFLPYSFRVKVVPCLQPVTNTVYPPKDISNPFDKVL